MIIRGGCEWRAKTNYLNTSLMCFKLEAKVLMFYYSIELFSFFPGDHSASSIITIITITSLIITSFYSFFFLSTEWGYPLRNHLSILPFISWKMIRIITSIVSHDYYDNESSLSLKILIDKFNFYNNFLFFILLFYRKQWMRGGIPFFQIASSHHQRIISLYLSLSLPLSLSCYWTDIHLRAIKA